MDNSNNSKNFSIRIKSTMNLFLNSSCKLNREYHRDNDARIVTTD